MAARRSREEWYALVQRWRRSDLTQRAFAAAEGLNENTLKWWCSRFRKESPAFLEVVIEEPPTSAPDFQVEIGDFRVRVPVGFDAGELRRLVHALC